MKTLIRLKLWLYRIKIVLNGGELKMDEWKKIHWLQHKLKVKGRN